MYYSKRDVTRDRELEAQYYKDIESRKDPIVEEQEDELSVYKLLMEQRNTKAKYDNKYREFVSNVKKTLLKETLETLYTMCLTESKIASLSSNSKLYISSIIENYVDKNYIKVLNTINNTNTHFMSNLSKVIDESFNNIIRKVDPTEATTFVISEEDVDSFFNKLDKESFEDASETIRMRVSNAIEEFITDNKQEKANIESLLKNTQTNINDKDMTEEDIKEAQLESTIKFKRKLNDINKYKTKTLLYEMVHNMAKEIVSDESLQESFIESNKLDMSAILEHCELSYTLLELLNTTKLEEQNKDSISSLIS